MAITPVVAERKSKYISNRPQKTPNAWMPVCPLSTDLSMSHARDWLSSNAHPLGEHSKSRLSLAWVRDERGLECTTDFSSITKQYLQNPIPSLSTQFFANSIILRKIEIPQKIIMALLSARAWTIESMVTILVTIYSSMLLMPEQPSGCMRNIDVWTGTSHY